MRRHTNDREAVRLVRCRQEGSLETAAIRQALSEGGHSG